MTAHPPILSSQPHHHHHHHQQHPHFSPAVFSSQQQQSIVVSMPGRTRKKSLSLNPDLLAADDTSNDLPIQQGNNSKSKRGTTTKTTTTGDANNKSSSKKGKGRAVEAGQLATGSDTNRRTVSTAPVRSTKSRIQGSAPPSASSASGTTTTRRRSARLSGESADSPGSGGSVIVSDSTSTAKASSSSSSRRISSSNILAGRKRKSQDRPRSRIDTVREEDEDEEEESAGDTGADADASAGTDDMGDNGAVVGGAAAGAGNAKGKGKGKARAATTTTTTTASSRRNAVGESSSRKPSKRPKLDSVIAPSGSRTTTTTVPLPNGVVLNNNHLVPPSTTNLDTDEEYDLVAGNGSNNNNNNHHHRNGNGNGNGNENNSDPNRTPKTTSSIYERYKPSMTKMIDDDDDFIFTTGPLQPKTPVVVVQPKPSTKQQQQQQDRKGKRKIRDLPVESESKGTSKGTSGPPPSKKGRVESLKSGRSEGSGSGKGKTKVRLEGRRENDDDDDNEPSPFVEEEGTRSQIHTQETESQLRSMVTSSGRSRIQGSSQQQQHRFSAPDSSLERSPTPPSGNYDMDVAIPASETPVIRRNMAFRGETKAKKGGSGNLADGDGGGEGDGNSRGRRRSSLDLRGARASSIGTGFETPPHPSLPDDILYRHVPPNDPPAIRMRTIIAWSAFRRKDKIVGEENRREADRSLKGPSSSSSFIDDERSRKIRELVNVVVDREIKNVCHKQLDLSWMGLPPSPPKDPARKLRPHEQNVKNARILKQLTEVYRKIDLESKERTKTLQHYQIVHQTLENNIASRSNSSRVPPFLPNNPLPRPAEVPELNDLDSILSFADDTLLAPTTDAAAGEKLRSRAPAKRRSSFGKGKARALADEDAAAIEPSLPKDLTDLMQNLCLKGTLLNAETIRLSSTARACRLKIDSAFSRSREYLDQLNRYGLRNAICPPPVPHTQSSPATASGFLTSKPSASTNDSGSQALRAFRKSLNIMVEPMNLLRAVTVEDERRRKKRGK